MSRSSALMVGVLVAFAVGCGDGGRSGQREGDAAVVAVIEGIENPFVQASALESLATQRPGCLVVNPITRTNIVEQLSHAPEGTPVVNIDSPVDEAAAKAVGVAITTYVGTDNIAAGRRAADAMAGFVDRGARVAVIAGIPGDAGSGARTQEFTRAARGRFGVAHTVAADFVPEQARLAAEELLREDAPVDGFFAVNDEMALGIAQAVRAAGRTGEVAVIGMDGIRRALTAIERGAMSATIAQYPYAIGQLGVEACLAAMRGEAVPARVDAPVQIVTVENVARAQAKFPQSVRPFDDPFAPLPAD